MSVFKRNILANFFGGFWAAALSIVLAPIYIHYLGIETYGLIGFYIVILGSMSILDFGLSTTLNRELAKLQNDETNIRNVRDLTFSLECIYWAIGLVISILVIVFSSLISKYWIQAESLSFDIVRKAVIMMGVVIAFQWPISLYNGGLRGLEKQVLNSAINVIMSTLRAAGVILIIVYVSPSVEAFFIWQAVISFLFVLVMRFALWKQMPKALVKPKFSKVQLKIIWRFAAGMTGIGVITFFLAHVDKILLSKILSLSEYGYYLLAFSIASAISLLTTPISITIFPRLTKLVHESQEGNLKSFYHDACKLMAVLVFPFSLTLIFFMKDIIRIWTGNPLIVDNSYLIAQILVIGSTLNALMIVPYNLLLANGMTRFTIIQNLVAVVLLFPLLILLTTSKGSVGAAFVWVLINAGYVFISQPVMHRILLKGHLYRWYIQDTLLPLLFCLSIVLMLKGIYNILFSHYSLNLFVLTFFFCFTFIASLATLKKVREFIIKSVHFYFYRK